MSDYFQEKLITKFIKKCIKRYFWSILSIFKQNMILLKILSRPFFLILTKYHCAKLQKKKKMNGFRVIGKYDRSIFRNWY